ncbi:MAG: zinc transporter 9 [Parasphingorhabdus sp.]|jgi:zinc transporter 9
MASGSKGAVLLAITGNTIVTILKFGAAQLTFSASMMNEAVHSLMDTVNQIFLFMGLQQGGKPADQTYAFGHGQKKYLWNLWSAIGLFSIGSGLGLSHAWHSYHALGDSVLPSKISIIGYSVDPIWVSAIVLLVALVIEAYVLLVAAREVLSRMHAEGEQDLLEYMKQADDPTLLAVLLEDSVAVLGVILAAIGIGMSRLTGNAIWDIGFSVVIALLLAIVAIILGWINMRYLTAIRDKEAEMVFRDVVKSHAEIERFHDLRSLVVDENHTVLVAEIEIREEVLMSAVRIRVTEIEAAYLDVLPGNRRYDTEVLNYVHSRSMVQATLEQTERLIDELEVEIRSRCPQVVHCTIEVQGLAPSLEFGAPVTS